MTGAGSEAQAAGRQLERVLASAGFSRNERLSRFLRFIVELHLEGKDDELKESIIAIEVFGRSDHDPQKDSIVRTEASRLRARLGEYYLGEGKDDPLVIELPKGGYVPILRQAEKTPESNRSLWSWLGTRAWLIAALTSLAVALAALGLRQFHQNAPVAIAVLPLENLSHDPANDYFADGLTDELIRNLSLIDGLAPRSRTSSFAFKGKPRNMRETGKQLGADYILEGSVLHVGQHLRINAQLIRVRDDFLLWSGKFDRELTDVFAIQEEISRGIVNNLRLKLGQGRRRYETSVEAYDLYLRARALGYSNESIGPFEEAIAKDPSFAPAYAGLAENYAQLSGFGGTFLAADRADLVVKMSGAAEKAIELDPLLAEAHDALGMVYARYAQWEQSETSFRRAIELDPNRSTTYVAFDMNLLLPLGRIEEALHQIRIAEKADPLSPEVHAATGWVLISAGRYDEAVGYCQKLPADHPARAYCMGRTLLGQGRTGEAIQVLAAAPNPNWLGYAYGRAGRREEAEKIASASPNGLLLQALIFAGMGEKERTLQALERLATLGPVRLGRDLTYPEFDLVRGDPRLKALRKKVGLPE
jgi:TolB-like protein